MTIPTSGEISFSDFYIPAGVDEDIPIGTYLEYDTLSTWSTEDFECDIAFDENVAGRFAIIYRHVSTTPDVGYVRVGNISGTGANRTVTMGSAYSVGSSSGIYNYPSICFDPHNANKFLIIFGDISNSYKPGVRIGTITNNNQISFGTVAYLNTAISYYMQAEFDPHTANRVLLTYKDSVTNQTYGLVKIGTVSGTSISFGSSSSFSGTDSAWNIRIAFDPNNTNKFVVVWTDINDSSEGNARVGTISGTSVSWGTTVIYHSTSQETRDISFDPNTAGKFVVAYRDAGASNKATCIVGTLSGTSVSFGSEYVAAVSTYSTYIRCSYDRNQANTFVITWTESNKLYAKVGTVSGTSISFGSVKTLYGSSNGRPELSFDPNTAGVFAVAWQRIGDSPYVGRGRVSLGQVAT
jgi:hypothetical protein